MSAAVFLRKVADFLDTHPAETGPFTVTTDDGEVSFFGREATVTQVDDLLTAVGGGTWSESRGFASSMYITSSDTPLGEVTIFAPAHVLDDVVAGLPDGWVAA